MVSEAMLLVERSFGTGEKEERSSSSCGSEKVSHEGDEGKADGKMQEKRKERPELKVVICKDGRSSARVGHIFTGLRCPWGLWGSMGVLTHAQCPTEMDLLRASRKKNRRKEKIEI